MGYRTTPCTYVHAPPSPYATLDYLVPLQFCRFELVRSKNIETYVTIKGNKGQISWLWKKVWTGNGHGESFQEFLDSHQYTLNGILRLVEGCWMLRFMKAAGC